jgi:hypothetical protein
LAVAHARMEVALSAIRVPQIRTAVGCAHLVHNECALSKGGSGAVLPLPGNLYLAPIIGVVMALVVVAVVGYRKRKIWNTCRVTATSAWDASDSWVTNTAGVGSAVAAIAASGSISSFVTKVNADAFVLLSLLFGGCAAIAPVVYGERHPGIHRDSHLCIWPLRDCCMDRLLLSHKGLRSSPCSVPGSWPRSDIDCGLLGEGDRRPACQESTRRRANQPRD